MQGESSLSSYQLHILVHYLCRICLIWSVKPTSWDDRFASAWWKVLRKFIFLSYMAISAKKPEVSDLFMCQVCLTLWC